MSIWLEIHCDVRSDGPRDLILLDPFCHGQSARQIGGMACNGQESVRQHLKDLEKEAKRLGWIKGRRGWVCPNCKTMV